LAACETAPVGPGRSIDAAQSSIQFTHPLYPDVQGEYTQRSGSYSSQTETAFFPGKTGAVFVSYNQSAGDTYFSTTDIHEIVESIGTEPEKNEIKEEGELPDTFPVVQWASYSAIGEDGQAMSCVSITRNGASAGSAGGGAYTSALIIATECRGPYMDLGEREAAMLSGGVRIR
jgi:hypothetical protein